VRTLQGQLQQLFDLHDFRVEQDFIDTLPLFMYMEVHGLKEAFDHAVFLCEFEGEDLLRFFQTTTMISMYIALIHGRYRIPHDHFVEQDCFLFKPIIHPYLCSYSF
jgi:hypothetical protein